MEDSCNKMETGGPGLGGGNRKPTNKLITSLGSFLDDLVVGNLSLPAFLAWLKLSWLSWDTLNPVKIGLNYISLVEMKPSLTWLITSQFNWDNFNLANYAVSDNQLLVI